MKKGFGKGEGKMRKGKGSLERKGKKGEVGRIYTSKATVGTVKSETEDSQTVEAA